MAVPNASGNQSFFASFCSQKEVLASLLMFSYGFLETTHRSSKALAVTSPVCTAYGVMGPR
jgi:hypothetical protein